MKISFKTLLLLIVAMIFSACSKPGGTKAGVKLNIAGITALSSTAGTGGTLLFGRSSTGELFGKIINGTEDTLNLQNGDWALYALMWDTNSSGLMMNDKVFCAKSTAKLTGVDVNLSLNLTNDTCSDPEFSNGRTYMSGALVRFADVFIEECDNVNASTNWFCGMGNQGSALSYRIKFQDFNKIPGSNFSFGSNVITSSCQTAGGMKSGGLPINFPSGNGVTPLIVSVEFFLGSATCDTTEAKGVQNVLLPNGLGAPAPFLSKVVSSTTNCSFSTPDFTGTNIEKSNLCEGYLGTWSGSSCLSVPSMTSRFAPTCSSQTTANAAIKHLIALPKGAICDKYANVTTTIGSHPFAAGDGSLERPYKICTEWQLNQIGEATTSDAFPTFTYKLMNDLDMNKTDIINPASRPTCSNYPSGILKDHHNLNSLDRITADCMNPYSTTGFSGTFFGGGHVIRNARIQAETVPDLGFVRKLVGSGRILDLAFVHSEVRGLNNVGTVAGSMQTASNVISNIIVDDLNLEGRSNNGTDGMFVGGITGNITSSGSSIRNAHVTNAKIRGRHMVGGLVGQNYGDISLSHFRGTITTQEEGTGAAGGLVGLSNGGTISYSYAEGLINSSLQNVGGVVGKIMGTLNTSYSTMVLVQRYNAGTSYLGGIAGDASSGSISNSYFDGVLKYSGSGSPVINGIYSLGSGGTNNYSSYTNNSPGGSYLSSTALRSALPTFAISADWNFTVGSLPRLTWEPRECLTLTNQDADLNKQVAIGRGSAVNPIVICNQTQFINMNVRAATENYILKDDINLSGLAPFMTLGSFNGQLNGNGKTLYGLNLTYAVGDNAAANEGIFRTVGTTATIANLNLYGNTFNDLAGTDDVSAGLLAGQNLGIIANINLMGNSFSGYQQSGLVVGQNKNILKDVYADQNDVTGISQTGGIVGYNFASGKILRTMANVNITPNGASYSTVGGIAGYNAGVVDMVEYKGQIKTGTYTSGATRAGGIVGYNVAGGQITNALFSNYGMIQLANSNNVGGLVGDNFGSIDLSISLGKMIYSYSNTAANPGDNFHPITGNNSGTVGSYVLALQNKIASMRGQGTSSACTGDGTTPCSVSPSIPTNSNLFELSNNNSGNLSTLIPMTASTNTFIYTGNNISSTQLNFYESFVLADATALRTVTQLQTLATYCPGGFTSNDGAGVCTAGFNVAESKGTEIGNDRMIAYYMAMMNNQIPPANSPVWEFSTDEGPRLFQLND